MTGNMELIEGPRLRLRLVQPADAAYIHGLRTDPRYNQHLSAVTGTVEGQRAWIERYKEREAQGSEFYFLIERRDNGTPCGVVRLYDIKDDCFTWGSWILDENKPFMAALESAVLLYQLAFEALCLARSTFEVRLENEHTIKFHRRFGAIETYRDDMNIYFEINKVDFLKMKTRHMNTLQRRK